MSFPFTLPCGQRDFAAGTIVLSIRSKDIKVTQSYIVNGWQKKF